MPFLAICPECDQSQICVLDAAVRPRLVCTRCRLSFATAEVESEQEYPDAIVDKLPETAPPPPAIAAPVAEFAPRESTDSTGSRLSVLGLLLLASGLLTALFDFSGFLLPAVAGLSSIVAIFGIRATRRVGGLVRYPLVIAALASLVLVVSVVPRLLTSGSDASDRAATDKDIRVVPSPGHEFDGEFANEGWADAGRASLVQGRVRVEVAEAWVIPVGKGDARRGSEDRIYIRVRLFRSKTGEQMAAGAFSPPLAWDRSVRGILHDAGGAEYQQLAIDSAMTRTTGHSAASGISMDVTDEVLAFAAPTRRAEGLRLEFSGTAWGGVGTFRFLIPGSLMRSASVGPRLPKAPT